MHLKAIQQMARAPRSIGVPPLSDSTFEQALTVQVSNNLATLNGNSGPRVNTPGGTDDEGKINPLAGMGLTDDQYSAILQNLVNGESFMDVTGLDPADPGPDARPGSSKRPLEQAAIGQGDGRAVKRGRFEIME
jgi:osomolarity two-component system response regulator SKN7